jgi:hypothetical protein
MMRFNIETRSIDRRPALARSCASIVYTTTTTTAYRRHTEPHLQSHLHCACIALALQIAKLQLQIFAKNSSQW